MMFIILNLYCLILYIVSSKASTSVRESKFNVAVLIANVLDDHAYNYMGMINNYSVTL